MLLALALTCARSVASQEDAPDPAALLADAVDRPTPAERREAARELAHLDEVPLQAWLEAAAAFAPREDEAFAEPGQRSVTAELLVEGEAEATELVVVVPERAADAGPAPLLVALHGAGGRGASMVWAWRETAAALGAVLLAPTEAGPNAGFAGTVRERRAVVAAIRWLRRRVDVDEDRIWLTGYSRGAHLCWDLALRHPDRFAAAIPIAGGPRFTLADGQNTLRFHENLAGLRVRALVGEHEDPGLRWNAAELVDRLEDRDVDAVELHVLAGLGHEHRPQRLDDWSAWLAASVRDPWPERVVRRSVRLDEGTRAWLTVTDLARDVEETFRPELRVSRQVADDQERLRRLVIDQAEEKTARVEAERDGDSLTVEAERATGARLLLPLAWLPDDGRLRLRADGRRRTVRVEPDTAVLLEHFVEHFDRRFLPVAAIEVKLRGR